MSKIGIITNPHSKLNKRNPTRPQLLGYILGEKGILEITKSLEHLRQVAENFRDNAIDILAINGGDGTISRTLSAFVDAYGDKPLPKIMVLKGGTMNVLALNLGIRGKPESILSALLERISQPEPLVTRRVPSLRVEDNIGFIYADGSSANILKEFYQDKTGRLGAIWLGVKLSASALVNGEMFQRLITPNLVSLRDGTQPAPLVYEGTSLSNLASTLERLPLGMPMFRHMHGAKQEFESVIINPPAKKLLWYLPIIMLQKKSGQSLGKFTSCHKDISFTFDNVCDYTLDGELHVSRSPSLSVTLGPSFDFILI